MKLIRFTTKDGAHLGVLEGADIADLTQRIPGLGMDMKALISRWDELRPHVEAARGQKDLKLVDADLLAPIDRPGKIWGIGLNYADHIAEAGTEKPALPSFFVMAQTTVADPYAPIERPRVSKALDYEAELVFVVGRGGRHIPRETAAEHIFGYCCGNDVSVRDWQLRTGQFSIGKSFDGHAPIGPWIVTADEIDPANLPIRCLVNGETRQESNTSHLIFSPADQLSHLSEAMTMEPGDIIFTGTPGGVGAAMTPPQFLVPGDRVRVEIDGIGHIENLVVEED